MPDLGFSPPLAGREQDEFTSTGTPHTLCKTLLGILKDENKSKKTHAGPEIQKLSASAVAFPVSAQVLLGF